MILRILASPQKSSTSTYEITTYEITISITHLLTVIRTEYLFSITSTAFNFINCSLRNLEQLNKSQFIVQTTYTKHPFKKYTLLLHCMMVTNGEMVIATWFAG